MTISLKFRPTSFLFIFLMMVIVWAGCKNPETANQEKVIAENPDSTKADTLKTATKYIVFFGNSLTAGYGVDPSEAFAALIQNRLDSMSLAYEVINAGLSGETTAGGNSRIDWILKQQPIDIFVLELGANDGLRGIAVTETKKNLEAMIEKVKKAYPEAKVILAGMMVPPNMGPDYSRSFQRVFPEVAKSQNVALIPFLLEGVGGVDSLNQGDGIHPTPEGHKILAENVWMQLEKQVR